MIIASKMVLRKINTVLQIRREGESESESSETERQKQKQTDKTKQTKTETDRNRQKQTDKNRQTVRQGQRGGETETERQREERTYQTVRLPIAPLACPAAPKSARAGSACPCPSKSCRDYHESNPSWPPILLFPPPPTRPRLLTGDCTGRKLGRPVLNQQEDPKKK